MQIKRAVSLLLFCSMGGGGGGGLHTYKIRVECCCAGCCCFCHITEKNVTISAKLSKVSRTKKVNAKAHMILLLLVLQGALPWLQLLRAVKEKWKENKMQGCFLNFSVCELGCKYILKSGLI